MISMISKVFNKKGPAIYYGDLVDKTVDDFIMQSFTINMYADKACRKGSIDSFIIKEFMNNQSYYNVAKGINDLFGCDMDYFKKFFHENLKKRNMNTLEQVFVKQGGNLYEL